MHLLVTFLFAVMRGCAGGPKGAQAWPRSRPVLPCGSAGRHESPGTQVRADERSGERRTADMSCLYATRVQKVGESGHFEDFPAVVADVREP